MSDLIKGLSDLKLTLEERLKVACYLWKTPRSLSSSGKKYLLLRWTCQELCGAFDKRSKSSSSRDPSLVCKLCKFFHLVLAAVGEECEEDTDLSSVNLHLLQVFIFCE